MVKLTWKIIIVVLGVIGLSTCLIRTPGFWTSYVLDIVGPAWNYVLLRGQYSSSRSFLSLKLTPETAALLILVICFLIETSQYYELYNAHFDPYDYIAYISALLPCYVIDKWLCKIETESQ